MRKNDLTTEEFDDLYQKNEVFNGKCADFGKLQLYQSIKAELTDFLHRCDDVLQLTEIKPNQRERNALVCLDIKSVSTFGHEELVELAAIMSKADRVIVSGARDTCVRLSFGIENIWND